VAWLLVPGIVRGQQAPPTAPSAPQPVAPPAPPGQPAPQPEEPTGQVPTQRGAPLGQAIVPEPILQGFPSPTIPVGEPIPAIAPIRPLRFAPQPEGVSPLQLRTFLTVEEEYTDNADQTKTNKTSEFRTNVAVGISGHLEGARSNLDFAYSPRAVIHRNAISDTDLDQSLSLRGGANVTPLIRLSAGEDFTQSHDFRDVGNIGTTRTGQNSFTTNRATAEAAYTPPQGRIALAYTNVLNREDVPNPDNSLTNIVQASGDLTDPSFGVGGSYTLTRGLFDISSDYWAHTLEGHAKRPVTPTAAATLSGLFTQHDADRPQAQDYRLGHGRVGGEWTLSPDAFISVQAGAGVFAPHNDKTLVRPSVVALWTQRFSYFSLSAGYNSGFQENFQSVDNTGVSYVQSASLYLTSLAFRDFTATVGARWNRQKFEQTTLSAGLAGTRETTWDLEARLEYVLARSLVLTLGYIYTIRSSTNPAAAFVENRVRLGLTYRYDIL
jgi:hypothetical protein